MRYNRLGSTGLIVSELCLGAMTFGTNPGRFGAIAGLDQAASTDLVKQAFDADGVTLLQFNEAPAGQSVFHLHVHVIPRFEGVALKPHTGQMEKPEVLAANAEKIRAALSGI